MEDVTRRYGRGSIGLGHAGIRGGPDWTMKRDMLSPRYTTHWDELPSSKPPNPTSTTAPVRQQHERTNS